MQHRLSWARLKTPLFFAWIAALAIALSTIPINLSKSIAVISQSTIQFVPPSWVAENVKDPNLRILDVRTVPLEYIEGHLPGAINIAENVFRGSNGFLPAQSWDTN